MKKVIRIILLVVVILIILGVGVCAAILHLVNERNKNYYKYATPAGEIEAKYTDLGSYDVEQVEYDADNDVYGKYEIWFPSELQNGAEKYPLVVMANGTGIKASQYKEVFKHLASWGFIVIGNEDENSRTGESSTATLEFILNENANIDSLFFGKIDTENIGVAGHSQGGIGAINAVTNQANGSNYKTVFAASATSKYHADELNKAGTGWSCDLSKINIPVFMVAGTGFMDAGTMDAYSNGQLPEGSAQGICPLWWLEECYNAMPDSNSKVIARMVGKDHGDMLRSSDGYMTAWFMYWLKDDKEAGNAFVGIDAEISINSNYQDVRNNIN